MIKINEYIIEKLKIDKESSVKKDNYSDELYDFLVHPKFCLNFKGYEDNKTHTSKYIYKIPEDKLKYYKDALRKCFGNNFSQDVSFYKMAVWNNGNLHFTDKSRYSQGEIVDHNNNTNFVYYILVDKDLNCQLCGYQRRYYGQDASIGDIYKFEIK